MHTESTVQMAILVVTGVCLLSTCDAATTTTLKLCGRKLGVFMSQICHAYNSPAWDNDPSVIDHTQAQQVRQKRELGIADVCCKIGCTWEEISEYCLISPKYQKSPPFDVLEGHMIEDRSAEKASSVEIPGDAAAAEDDKLSDERRAARRSEAREDSIKNVAAPVVGTVSPLLTWARTLYTDLPSTDRDRYAYVVYAQP